HKQIRVLPAIEPKGHLIEIGRKVLGADFVPRSNDSSLEKREGRLYRVRVDVATNIFSGAMRYGVMGKLSNGLGITAEVIRENHVNVITDVFLNVLRQSARFNVLSVEEPQIAAALPNADHDFFP